MDAKTEEAGAKVGELDGKAATATLSLDTGEFDSAGDGAAAKLDELGSKTETATLLLNTAEFDAAADDATVRLQALRLQAAGSGLGGGAGAGGGAAGVARGVFGGGGAGGAGVLPGGGVLPALAGAGAVPAAGVPAVPAVPPAPAPPVPPSPSPSPVPSPASGGGSGGGEGSLLGAVALLGGGLLPGVGGAVTGLGLLGATGMLAFGGVGKALSAAHQASNTVGLTGAQLAATNFSNSVQVVQAQQSVTQARRQAAQDAITSNQSIQEADMNLAETERNTAASRVQALQQVTQAQQGVQTATYSLSEANYNLAQAYEAAREQIAQAQDQLADSKLSVQAASLAVQQAEYQEKLVNQDAYSTSLDRQQAALAVAQAKQQLQDATDNQADAEYKANLVTKQGIDGSQQVIQAKQAQTAAQYQLTDANAAYSQAQTALTDTELNNATQVKEAQMQAAAAREQAAYQQKSDAIAVAAAERNLTDTIKEQKLQMAAMESTANQAANMFAKYMARLTPAGRALVNQVLGMKGAFKGLEAAAQTSTLPGFTAFLKGIAHLMPQIKSGVTGMGGAVSKAFARMGAEMKTPQAVKVFNGLITNGMTFANTVLPAVGRAFGAVFNLGSSKGAAAGLSNLLGGIFDGIAGFAKGLKPYIPAFNAIWTAVGKIAKAVGPALAQDIGGLATVLGYVAKFLNSKQGQPFVKLIANVVTGLLTMKGLAKLLPGELGKSFASVKGLLGIPKQIGSAWKIVTGLPAKIAGAWGKLTTVATVVRNWGAWSAIASGATKLWTGIQAGFNLIMSANPIALVAIALVALGVGIVEAYKHFAWFRDGVKDVFDWLKTGALFLWHNVFDPVWHGIETGAKWLYDNAIKPLWNNWIKPVFDYIRTGLSRFVGDVETGWDKLEGIFKTPVNFLINTVYDKGIAALWNDVVGAVGLGSLKLPIISGLAGGGVIPGYAPGHDTVPALLSPGEAVLTPGATRAIGGAPAVNALNAAYAPPGAKAAPGHYSLGGIVSGLLHGGEATAKAVAALATGNATAFVNALSGLIRTSAAGNLGQVMTAMPKTLLTDAAKAAIGMMGGSSGKAATSGQVASWMAQGTKAAGVPASWIPDLEIIAQHESSDSPGAVNNSDSNAAAGNASRGILQLVPTTFAQYHVPGTSMNIFDPVANIAAGSRYIEARYGTVANVPGIKALNQGKSYVGYDSGGVLPPGVTAAVNQTGKPEAVLTPQQTQALSRLASGAAAAQPAPVVNVYFTGTQVPSHEQMAEIERRLSLAVGGG